MERKQSHPYLHVGSARDLTGRDRFIYRLFEILPGFLSIGTLLSVIILSFVAPAYGAYFTIVFSVYWLFKTAYLSVHLRHNFKRLRHAMTIDWNERLTNFKVDDLVHLVIFPLYKEPYEVLEGSMKAVLKSSFAHKQIVVVIAVEERAGPEARAIAERAVTAFKDKLFDCITVVHPDGLLHELAGKGSNIAYAAKEARIHLVDAYKLPYEKVLVSAFDVDTVVYPEYFACLTWHFLTAERPHRVSFQPVPLFNNNIWQAPTLSRVLAYSSTFWQMIQQERPEKLATFSSHSMSLRALHDAGYWQTNIVSEDSRIYWNLFMYFDGDYAVVPMSYPVSMDANVAPTFWGTARNLYRQHRRWTWGVENIPYILFNFMHNPRIPFGKKVRAAFVQIEGFWSLATNPLILFFIGWMPLIVGGHAFNATVLSYNLPIVAKTFLTFAMLGLVLSAIFAINLMPKRPDTLTWKKTALVLVQWILVPVTMVIFSAIPGVETQIRLLLGRYMGFWVTPKERTELKLQSA